MAIIPEKPHAHCEQQSNGTTNVLPSCSGRKPSTDQQRKSTSRSSAGRARSTRPFRDSLRSAVPDTALITMAKRPDRGGTGDFFSSSILSYPMIISSWSKITNVHESFQMSYPSNTEMSSI